MSGRVFLICGGWYGGVTGGVPVFPSVKTSHSHEILSICLMVQG